MTQSVLRIAIKHAQRSSQIFKSKSKM